MLYICREIKPSSFYSLVWKRRNTCSIVGYKGNDHLTTSCVSFFRRSRTFLSDKYLGFLWNSLLTILPTWVFMNSLLNYRILFTECQNVILIRFFCSIYKEWKFVKKKKKLKYLNYKYKIPYITNALKKIAR